MKHIFLDDFFHNLMKDRLNRRNPPMSFIVPAPIPFDELLASIEERPPMHITDVEVAIKFLHIKDQYLKDRSNVALKQNGQFLLCSIGNRFNNYIVDIETIHRNDIEEHENGSIQIKFILGGTQP